MPTKYHWNGKEINLTGDNIVIKSDNFNVNENGDMTCSNANVTGGSIDLKGEENDTVKIKVSRQGGTYSSQISPSSFKIMNGNELVFWANPTLTAFYSPNGTTSAISGGYMELRDILNEATIKLDSRSGNITCVSLTQTSKQENKKNFEKLKNALEILKKTDIYKYNLKTEEDGDKKHIGFVIGENYNYATELTSEDKDGKEIGVDNYSMTSVLWKAVQEQQEQIEELKKEIKELKGER